jgi:hypothetical protein
MQPAVRLKQKIDSVQKTLQPKIGKEMAATAFRSWSNWKLPLQAAMANGAVDWNKIAIATEGDRTVVRINNQINESLGMVKVGQQWYLDLNYSDAVKEKGAYRTALIDQMIAVLNEFEKRTQLGQVHPDNMSSQILDCMRQTMGVTDDAAAD